MEYYQDYTGLTIFAISGFKGSGKTTVGKLIQELKPNVVLMSFAEPIYQIADIVFKIPNSDINFTRYMELEGYNKKELPIKQITEYDFYPEDITLRTAINSIGEGLKKLMWPSIWVDIMAHKINREYNKKHNSFICITDVRYHLEIEMLEEYEKRGAKIVRIIVCRDKATPMWYKHSLFEDFEKNNIPNGVSPSEYEWVRDVTIGKYNQDISIHNNMDINSLRDDIFYALL